MLTHCWPVLYLLSPQLTDGITHLRMEKTVNKNKIIKLAREAGCHASVITGAVCFNPDVLERFVALVAAHERERCALVCITLGDYYAECDDFEAEDVAHACASSIRENNK